MRASTWITLLIAVVGLTAYLTWRAVRTDVPPSPYEMVGSVKEIMEGIIEPAADVVFESVAVVNGPSGTTERMPKTDEEWAAVEHNALMLAEAANLLKMPGRPVDTGEETAAPRTAVPELTAGQILQKIDADRSRWNDHATSLLRQAKRAIDSARKRNVEGLYEVGGDLDEVCENCHKEYWYPDAPGGAKAR